MSGAGARGAPSGARITRSSESETVAADSWSVVVTVEGQFEECLEFSWKVCPVIETQKATPRIKHSVVEMVIDRSGSATVPARDAMVKRVEFGTDTKASLQNMPEGRHFLISLVCTLANGRSLRSDWTEALTLSANTRDEHLSNLDPFNKPHLNCRSCPCPGYIATKWGLDSNALKLRCRRCGCPCDCHVVVEVSEILRARTQKACAALGKDTVAELPDEAIAWDDRECGLWFLTNGNFHPREVRGKAESSASKAPRTSPGGPEGLSGKKGRVSVVTPTTESRQSFHQTLWKSFLAQNWPDKELVVIETYVGRQSEFFARLARNDSRITYMAYQRPHGEDWSIGLKRNIAAHLATGEFIANFDDDDIYAPTYLTTMVEQLEARRALAVTLSSWFVLDVKTNKWGFCDAIAWGLAQGLSDEAQDVRNWAYGYGFSYVNRRKTSLEVPYDDQNMGEDFSFVTRLQTARSSKSVQLIHDDFGICVHTQHGRNTSDTFPIREVPPEEALQLDVAELAVSLGLLLDLSPGSTETASSRPIVAHTLYADYVVKCPLRASVEDFLDNLELVTGSNFGDMKVHRVPPRCMCTDPCEREELAAEVLGVVALLEAWKVTKPDVDLKSNKEKRRELMLRQVKNAMRPTDRIPFRTAELWLARPMEGAEAEAASEFATDFAASFGELSDEERMFSCEVICQATSVKKFFSATRTFHAMLTLGADIAELRRVLGKDLPPKAKIFGELIAGADNRPLQDSDIVPDRVTVSEFNGRGKSLYMLFSLSQVNTVLRMLKSILETTEIQRKLDTIETEACGDQKAYGLKLVELLMTDVYPVVFSYYDVPCDGFGALKALPDAMTLVNMDPSLLERQLELETLMRNKRMIEVLNHAIVMMRQGIIPPPAVHQYLESLGRGGRQIQGGEP